MSVRTLTISPPPELDIIVVTKTSTLYLTDPEGYIITFITFEFFDNVSIKFHGDVARRNLPSIQEPGKGKQFFDSIKLTMYLSDNQEKRKRQEKYINDLNGIISSTDINIDARLLMQRSNIEGAFGLGGKKRRTRRQKHRRRKTHKRKRHVYHKN
jgi:hypothetical protein